MHPARLLKLVGLVLLSLLLLACEGYSQVGVSSTSYEDMSGGMVKVKAKKANGTAVQEFEVGAGYPGEMLEASVALTVAKGAFLIELLGKDDEVTLTLEARDGQTVSGQGQMMVDSLNEASYRVTAGEAEDVEYTIQYTY
jgi:hypothetical protein